MGTAPEAIEARFRAGVGILEAPQPAELELLGAAQHELNDALRFNQALKQPDMVKKANELALELVDSTPEQAKKFYDDQMAFWDPIIRQSGAKAE